LPSGAAAAIAKEALNFDESKFKAFGIMWHHAAYAATIHF